MKEHWDEVTMQHWIDACRNVYRDNYIQVKEFGSWQKNMLEMFFLAPYLYPGQDWDNYPDLRDCMQLLPIKKILFQMELKKYRSREHYDIRKRDKRDTIRFERCSIAIQEALDSTRPDERGRSLLCKREAVKVLNKFTFGEGFSLQSSCKLFIGKLLMKQTDGSDEAIDDAVDELPIPMLLRDILYFEITGIRKRFDCAECSMYRLVTSIVRGVFLSAPIRMEPIQYSFSGSLRCTMC